MSAKDSFIIATANTHFGQMIKLVGGLAPVAHVDILLLQEVYNMQAIRLEPRLQKAGFTLVHSTPRFGLAIALRTSSHLQPVPESAREHSLAKMGRIERTIVRGATDNSLDSHERGIISCEFRTKSGKHITVANVHPTTPVGIPPRARHKQIVELTRVLTAHYTGRCFVMGGDMNHYPGPRKIDKLLHSTANLAPVTIGSTPTWRVRGSEQEPFFKVAALFSRKPLDHFDGQHDIILYSSLYLKENSSTVIDIHSDHRAVITSFQLL